MDLDKQHPKPVYLQLKEMLQSQIEQGAYLSHQRLPSERDLCQIYNLSRMTARRALKELIAEGYAYTRVGKGTFVGRNFGDAVAVDTAKALKQQTVQSNFLNNEILDKLAAAFARFDCVDVDRIVGDILAAHPLEAVASKLFPQVIRLTEQQWCSGELGLLAHNYGINTLRSQLIAMMNATIAPKYGPKILLACAPQDQHELGLLSLAVSLRRRGYLVIYLGPYAVAHEFSVAVETAKPQLTCFSAATDSAVENLKVLGRQYRNKDWLVAKNEKPYFAFGGVAFVNNPRFAAEVDGIFLGNTLDEALEQIQLLVPVSNTVEH